MLVGRSPDRRGIHAMSLIEPAVFGRVRALAPRQSSG
ncbi:MAG: hypothetical protein QOG64_1043, partial [Acidimicrobiaceae bacterium]|nr:hypothetical protein [Acidimicrobiaceae bacterium]